MENLLYMGYFLLFLVLLNQCIRLYRKWERKRNPPSHLFFDDEDTEPRMDWLSGIEAPPEASSFVKLHEVESDSEIREVISSVVPRVAMQMEDGSTIIAESYGYLLLAWFVESVPTKEDGWKYPGQPTFNTALMSMLERHLGSAPKELTDLLDEEGLVVASEDLDKFYQLVAHFLQAAGLCGYVGINQKYLEEKQADNVRRHLR